MILSSHGIDTADVYDNELVHATVTLENGEEVGAVRYKDKVYTYKNE
jgi:nitrite reductase/ring-hydroxylating ferredoxin subunit